MKIHEKLFLSLLVLCLLFSMTSNAFAANYSGEVVKPGLGGILPKDTITFPDNTAWATLTARWGVRVTFVDEDESVLKSEVVPVSETEPGETTAPADPTRAEYMFVGWERHDENGGTAALQSNGSVTGVNGPGPIVFIANYEPVPPSTGDKTPVMLLVSLLAVSLSALVGAAIWVSRKKKSA